MPYDVQKPQELFAQEQRTLPPYNVRRLPLDTAQTDFEIDQPGDYIGFYTNGSYSGVTYKLNDPTNDPIPTGEFNSYYGHFEKVYVTWTAQASMYLRVFIGRGEQYRYKGT